MEALDFIKESYPGLNYSKKIIDIPDTNRVSMLGLFRLLGYTMGAEIGTLKGEFAETMFEHIPGLRLFCVDPYESYDGYREHRVDGELSEYEIEARERLQTNQAKFIKEYSPEAADQFKKNSLDFVYIDANHALKNVVDDICAWYPKVKHGGIISGHDYIKHKKSRGMHVVQAVNAFCDSYEVYPLFILGRKDKLQGEKRDRFRSWFFIKP